MKKNFIIPAVLILTALVLNTIPATARNPENGSTTGVSGPTRPVKLIYMEDKESGQGIPGVTLYLMYKTPGTSTAKVLHGVSDNKGAVVFNIPADEDGNSWPFVYGSDRSEEEAAIFCEMLDAQNEGKEVKMEGFRTIRVHKDTEYELEVTFGYGSSSIKGTIQIWS